MGDGLNPRGGDDRNKTFSKKHSFKLEPNCCILVRVNGRYMVGLLDSGAVNSCIREAVVQRFGFPRTNIPETNLYGANGEAIPVLGTSRLKVEVEGFRMGGEFKIIRNLSHQLILGEDFLSEHGFDMNFGSRVVTFGHELVAALKQKKTCDIRTNKGFSTDTATVRGYYKCDCGSTL